MTHTFLVELTDEVKGYEDSVDYFERVYGAEEFDLAEHNKQIRADERNKTIDECIKHIKLYKYNAGTYVVYDEILDEIAEQLKGAGE